MKRTELDLTPFEERRLLQLIQEANKIVALTTDVEDGRSHFWAVSAEDRQQILDVLEEAHAEAERELDNYRKQVLGAR